MSDLVSLTHDDAIDVGVDGAASQVGDVHREARRFGPGGEADVIAGGLLGVGDSVVEPFLPGASGEEGADVDE